MALMGTVGTVLQRKSGRATSMALVLAVPALQTQAPVERQIQGLRGTGRVLLEELAVTRPRGEPTRGVSLVLRKLTLLVMTGTRAARLLIPAAVVLHESLSLKPTHVPYSLIAVLIVARPAYVVHARFARASEQVHTRVGHGTHLIHHHPRRPDRTRNEIQQVHTHGRGRHGWGTGGRHRRRAVRTLRPE